MTEIGLFVADDNQIYQGLIRDDSPLVALAHTSAGPSHMRFMLLYAVRLSCDMQADESPDDGAQGQ